MRFPALVMVLGMLVLAAPAEARPSPHPQPTGLKPPARAAANPPTAVSIGSDVVTVDRTTTHTYEAASKTYYGYRGATFRCWANGGYGNKIFQLNVRWHWSWYEDVAGRPLYMKNAWHENSYPSNMNFAWSWEGSYHGAHSGGLGKAYSWYAQEVVGHFQAAIPPGITLNNYLSVYPSLNMGGSFFPSCRFSGSPL